MDSSQSFQFFNRGPSPVARLVFFSVLSLLLLFIDARYRYLESARSALSVLVSPIQKLAALPGTLLHQADDFFSLQTNLIAENRALQQYQNKADAEGQAQPKVEYFPEMVFKFNVLLHEVWRSKRICRIAWNRILSGAHSKVDVRQPRKYDHTT